ncbi:isoleucine--tRNA ligase [Patescibacteria group bacterium]|nr:isoleucine--tRNA ligase [Patescibacteria group bacterium]
MNFDFPKIEEKILKFWQEKKIFEKLRKKNQGKERWSFLDGPITANNPMGVHHAWGRTYKDLFQRYKAMQGFDQRFQNGFDCQGLWVEVEVEKEMGFKTKKDIEKFGIEKFVEACKKRVLKYSKIQTEQSIRLGQWMDWKNSYYTMSDENNYAIWSFLKTCWKKGLLYKGRDVVPWCPRCGTAISQHEILTEEYKELTHKSIFVKLPVEGRKNTFFLVWTTTPWTLPANIALAVQPRLTYAEVRDKKGGIFIVLKEKADLIPDGRIIKEFPGKELDNLKYQGMFDELEAVKKSMKKEKHRVILWKDVSEEEGTGIVHIAPGCGQEDFQLSKELKFPVVDPTDEESRYKDGFGFLAGKLVSEVNEQIFENLTKKGLVFKIEDYIHRYPTCWRCKEELIFRLVDEWYISMDRLRKSLMKVAKKIKWIPSFGLDRELDWLKNMQDWLISKKRYWGLALPIYECKCGNFEVIGSKEELKEKAVSGWDKFEGRSPHRPWVDEVKTKCSKCKKLVSRIPDVGNPWLDAGIVPFSTMEKEWFPAEFICESFPGQFKNWFYALIVMSTFLENTEPVKTIFGFASVKDEKGEEMHKSKGNVIWFDEAVDKIGADPMRWMYSRQNPVYNLKFGYGPAEEIKRKLLTLYNVYAFFETYVSKKELPTTNYQLQSNNILGRWIISRLNNLIGRVTRSLDRYNTSAATVAIEKFFIDDLSLWYVRRSRKRFHQGAKGRKEAIETLYYVLLDLTKLIAPIMPFFAEEMYSNLRLENMPESIHLFDWPKVYKEKIDKDLEEKMKQVRESVTQALAQRAELGIKVRQPLAGLKIKNKLDEELLELIKDEVNVKKITFGKEVKLDTKISKELREEGIVREVIRHIQEMRKKAGLKTKDRILVQCHGSDKLNKILVAKKDFIIKETVAEDFKIEKEEKFEIKKEIKADKEKLWLGIKKV